MGNQKRQRLEAVEDIDEPQKKPRRSERISRYQHAHVVDEGGRSNSIQRSAIPRATIHQANHSTTRKTRGQSKPRLNPRQHRQKRPREDDPLLPFGSPDQTCKRIRTSAVPIKKTVNEFGSENKTSPTNEQEAPAEEPKAPESKEKEKDDPISYWATNHTWPNNFAMSSNNTNKRRRTSDYSQSSKDKTSMNYSQSRKNRKVPVPYTKSYGKYILTQGLDMNCSRGREFVSQDSTVVCQELFKVTSAISPTVYPEDKIPKVIELCVDRNEAMVNRDITPLIVPTIKSLYLKDTGEQFRHFTDEVNTQWHESWLLVGPRPKPDLAVGFHTSAFTNAENAKLTNYTSFENLTRPTDELCFPFLMCEVKCGNQALDYADRQNMHSCSVAVKALLKLEQKADQYRDDKQFESLLSKILVYSISHDQNDARLYGYYALVKGENWTYHRHQIKKFDIANNEEDLVALHNFSRNVITVYASKLLKRLQKAIAALPDSSTLSSAGAMSLGDSQQGSWGRRDAEGFVIPGLPAIFDEQREQLDKLVQQSEQQRIENQETVRMLREQIEQQRVENKDTMRMHREQMDKLIQQMEQQRKENKEKEEKMEQQRVEKEEETVRMHREQMDKFIQQIEQQRKESKKTEEGL